jgi:integrase
LLAAFVSGEVNRSGKPVGRDYVRRVRAFLTAALRNDIRQGLLNQNPAEVAVIPASSTKKKDRRALTVAEWRSLFDAATGVYRLVIDLGGRHGLRPQEVRAVRWSDVDLAEGVLSVVTQLDADDEFSDTKTIKSTRTLRLHPDTVVLVGKWSATQAKQRERAGDRWTDRNLIVATRWGTAIDQDNHRRSIKRLCERAGVEAITPYELRHTAITHQIEEGHTASQVADWAGTSEQMIYNHYRHKIREVSDLQPPSYH